MNRPDISTPPALQWSEELLLGVTNMDAEHRRFVALIATLQGCADADLAPTLEEFAAHAKAHFAAEDASMVEIDLPIRDCHIDEHAAVLQSVDAVLALVRGGDSAQGRRLAQALADWFPGHVQHLDSAVSESLLKRRLGAKPVVRRRGVVRSLVD